MSDTIFLTDGEINELLLEDKQCEKIIGPNFLRGMKTKKGHGAGYMENHLAINRSAKNHERFHLIARKSIENPVDFSVILGYSRSQSGHIFKLCRYNGKSHEHRNKIEEERIYGFHIHTATERYQKNQMKEENYAEATNRYTDFRGAFLCLVGDCKINFVSDTQIRLI